MNKTYQIKGFIRTYFILYCIVRTNVTILTSKEKIKHQLKLEKSLLQNIKIGPEKYQTIQKNVRLTVQHTRVVTVGYSNQIFDRPLPPPLLVSKGPRSDRSRYGITHFSHAQTAIRANPRGQFLGRQQFVLEVLQKLSVFGHL